MSDRCDKDPLDYLDEAKTPQLLSKFITGFECQGSQDGRYCNCKSCRLLVLFEGIDGYVALLGKLNDYAGDPIELYVFPDDRAWADKIFHKITFSTGLIDAFLGLKSLPQQNLLGFELPQNDIFDNIVAIAASAWTIGHECSHIFYHQNDDFSDTLSNHALEADADRLAASFVYRVLQWLQTPTDDDENIRCLALYCIFSYLRSVEYSDGSANHPSTAMRLWLISSKLATLNKDPSEPSDNNFETLESKSASRRLVECLFRCEIEYQQLNPDDLTNLLTELNEIIKDMTFIPISERWDEMQDEIRERVRKDVTK